MKQIYKNKELKLFEELLKIMEAFVEENMSDASVFVKRKNQLAEEATVNIETMLAVFHGSESGKKQAEGEIS